MNRPLAAALAAYALLVLAAALAAVRPDRRLAEVDDPDRTEVIDLIPGLEVQQ